MKYHLSSDLKSPGLKRPQLEAFDPRDRSINISFTCLSLIHQCANEIAAIERYKRGNKVDCFFQKAIYLIDCYI